MRVLLIALLAAISYAQTVVYEYEKIPQSCVFGSPHGEVFWWETYNLNVTGCQQKCNQDELCNSIEYTIGGVSFEPGDCFLNKGTNHKDCQGSDYDVYIK